MANNKKVISKDMLKTLYLEEQKSRSEIAAIFGTTSATVKARLIEHEIPVRSQSESHAIRLMRQGPPQRKGSTPWNKGIPRTTEEKIRMSESQRRHYKKHKAPTGEKHSQWKGGKSVHRGYVLVWLSKDDPYAAMAYSNHGRGLRIEEHRLVMARHLGRPLSKDEIVHHLNGIKDDNRPENLAVVTKHNHETGTLIHILEKEVARLQTILEQHGIGYSV